MSWRIIAIIVVLWLLANALIALWAFGGRTASSDIPEVKRRRPF